MLEIAAKLSFKIEDSIEDVPEDKDHITRRQHLLPLYRFRKRWEAIKKKTLEDAANLKLSSPSNLDNINFFSLRTNKSLYSASGASVSAQTCQPRCQWCNHAIASATSTATEDKTLPLLSAAFEGLTFTELDPPEK